MKTDSNLSLANRKQLADMLGNDYHGLRSRVKDKLREKRQDLADSLEKEFAEKKGALKVITQINATREKLKEQDRDLALLGYELDSDGDLCLTGDAGRIIRKTIDAQLDKELGTLDDVDARFDSTQVAMMTVATLEDAEKLLKSVSSV